MTRASRRKPPRNESGPPLSPLPPPSQPLPGMWRWALPILLLLYLGLAIAHARLVPLGQTGYQNAPDEAAHVTYVRSVASGHLPTRAHAEKDPHGYEWHQPPLYYWLASLLLPFGERALRAASILCGLVGILLLYRAASLLFQDRPLVATVAAGLAALTPSHIAITSTVNNDALLEVCFSAALLILIGALRGTLTSWRAGWLGIAIGAAILTKATGVLLLPIALFAFVLMGRAGEPPRNLLRGAAWMGVLALAVCGWWFVRNMRLYGEWLPLQAFQKSFGGTVQAADVAAGRIPGLGVEDWTGYFWLVIRWTFQSFWAVYGTPQSALIGAPRFLPDQFYWLMGAVSVGSAAGLVREHLRRKTAFTEEQRLALWILFATVGVVALAFFAFVLRYFQTQGRYLYPAMLPICILYALGWRAVFPERYTALASAMLLALMAALAFAFLRYVAPA